MMLKERRLELGLQQKQVYEVCQIPEQTYIRWESGNVKPIKLTPTQYQKIKALFQCSDADMVMMFE